MKHPIFILTSLSLNKKTAEDIKTKIRLSIICLMIIAGTDSSLIAQVQIGEDIDFGPASSGKVVAINAAGNRIALGDANNPINGTYSGLVRVYDWTDGSWTQVGPDFYGSDHYVRFGESLSLSADGSRLAIGAPWYDPRGLIQVYDIVGDNWVQVGGNITSPDDAIGESLELSADGSILVTGSPYDEGPEPESGIVRVYTLSGGNWTQLGADIEGNSNYGRLGYSVACSADGTRIIASSPSGQTDSGTSGYAKVYEWTSGQWTQVGSTIEVKVETENAVSMSADGNRVAILRSPNNGNPVMYDFIDGDWVQVSQFAIEEAGANIDYAVSLSPDGNRLVLGAPDQNESVVRAYGQSNSGWVQWGSDIVGQFNGGRGVALSNDGSYLVTVGSANAQVYELPSPCLIDVVLTNQQEVDDFAVNYPDCADVVNLTIEGSDIFNLNGLSQIATIYGDLALISTKVGNLSGLENLTAVQGDLRIGNLDRTCDTGAEYCEWIDGGNNALTELSGLEGLTAIGGTLTIVGNNGLNDLTGLHNIETLGGLNIHGNNALTDLTGLGKLKTITGDFELFGNYKHLEEVLDLAIGLDEVYRALGSNTLASFAGLDSLTTIEGNLIIDDNSALVNLSGLEALTYVGEDVIIGTMDVNYIVDWFVYEPSGNDALGSLSGLENLTSIGGNLRIASNPNLPNCMGLDNLQTTGGLQVYENPVLTDLSGLESLTNIEGNLELYYERWHSALGYDDAGDNDAMTSLAGLENLNTINGELKIAENDLLNDLTAIDNLDHTSITNLILAINENLSVCNTTLICNYLENGGQSEIFNNAVGCSSATEIENACDTTTPQCPQGNITLSTQQQINDFPTNYPGCTEISGNLTIEQGSSSNITDLNSLSQLTSISGSLAIARNNITSLQGLNNLTFIGGGVTFDDNNSLTSLNGLDNLDTIGQELRIFIEGGLTSLDGIENLSSLGGLSLEYNPILTDLSALSNVSSLDGRLRIINSYALQSLSGLENITSVGDVLFIVENSVLPNLTGLDNLISVSDFVNVKDNNLLADFTGLNALTTIGGGMTIINNDNLTNLTALTNLTTLEGDLNVYNNNIISDLTGLDNIDYAGITNLDIRGNSQLSICHIESICNYLENGGTSTFNNTNATGCNNASEILDNCSVEVSTTTPYLSSQIIIYPNPSIGIFQVNGISQGTYQIHDTTGRMIQSSEMKNDLSIDISTEVQGVYFMSIQIENEVLTKRIIKL